MINEKINLIKNNKSIMTKYILHGGMTKVSNIHNKKFYQEMFRAAKGKPILACYYASPYAKWKDLLASDTERMKGAVGKKKFEIKYASKNAKTFLKQLKDAEAVYFRGGKTLKLMRRLKSIQKNLKKETSGKTILGSSAGALFLAKYYFDQDHDKIMKGLEILPAKIMTHYLASGKYAATSGKEKLQMLKDYKEKLPTYAIKETEFIILK
jgi:peptidase E